MTSDQPIFQVSELVEAINQHLSLLGEIVIEGEISRLDIKNGRLIFASVKDVQSSVDIFSLTNLVRNLRELEPGMLVHVYGTAGLYKGSGKFRVFASRIIPEGEGSLQVAFEKLKKQLENEGLFTPERKRPLPPWPKSIGLITAKNSSACADLIKILRARMPNINLKLLPVNVQGRDAAPSILLAYGYISEHPTDFDLIIMARGGGSLEDLAAFNSEEICRAMFACKVPVISAIGHEDNWSLTDYVADLRASTPSNAAELAVRDSQDVVRQIDTLLETYKHRLLATLHQNLGIVDKAQAQLRRHILLYSQTITLALPLLKTRLINQIHFKKQNLEQIDRLLHALDYRQILKRGFSLTTSPDGSIIHSVDDLKIADTVKTQLAVGQFTSQLTKIERTTL
jgi:exodeoxyribonuclease VII large subunit